jgi:hypothetical protein
MLPRLLKRRPKGRRRRRTEVQQKPTHRTGEVTLVTAELVGEVQLPAKKRRRKRRQTNHRGSVETASIAKPEGVASNTHHRR